jgi:hypothetical protein
VIPQDGVNNAQLRPVIDLMEIARRNGSLARLDLRPVVASVYSGKGYSSGGPVGSSSASGSSSPVVISGNSSAIDNETARQFTSAVERLLSWDPAISIELLERRQNLYNKVTKGGLK